MDKERIEELIMLLGKVIIVTELVSVKNKTDKRIHLVDGVGSLHLDIHGYEKGEEEENPAGESQQLAGGELRVGTNLRRRTTSVEYQRRMLLCVNVDKFDRGWLVFGKNPDQYIYYLK